MSAYDSMFARYARPQMESHFGRSGVTFTDVAASSTATVTAVVCAEADDLLEFDGVRERYRHRILEISTAQVTDASKLKRPNTFTIDGVVWTIHRMLGVEGGITRLELIAPERVEAAGRKLMK
jgi:hypothetical protein